MGIPILGDIVDAIGDLASEVIVDKDKRDELRYRLQELKDRADARMHEEMMGQIEVNKTEAAHRSIFVAGWRPFLGWCGGLGFFYNIVISPAFGLTAADTTTLTTILLAILGISSQRTYEKIKGVTNDAPVLFRKETPVERSEEPLPENAPWMK